MFERLDPKMLDFDPSNLDSATERKLNNYLNKFIAEIRENGLGLFFTGNYGSGKTQAATYVLERLVRDRNASVYVTDLDGVNDLLVNKDDASRSQKDKYLFKTDVLFIDSLPKMLNKSRDPKEVLATILRKRIEFNKITFLASHLSLEKISNLFGEEVASLLNQCIIEISLPKKDYRQEKVSQNKKLLED